MSNTSSCQLSFYQYPYSILILNDIHIDIADVFPVLLLFYFWAMVINVLIISILVMYSCCLRLIIFCCCYYYNMNLNYMVIT